MKGKGRIGFATALEQAFFGADLGTEMPLLPGLEEELDLSRQGIPAARHQPSGTDQHGRMCIVPAGVHSPRILRGKIDARVLGHGECVHIRPKQDAASRRLAFQGGDKTRRTPALLDLKIQPRQGFQHQGSRFGEIISNLGLSVQCPSQLDNGR